MATFRELGVRDDLLRAIELMGYENPMPIQEMVIPHLLNEDTDVVGLAQTGTGKTAAFGLPMLQRIDTSSRATQALILDPTRELCLQTKTDLEDYSRFIDGLRVLAVYGGASIEPQIKAIKQGVQVIVATPGRLQDLIRRGVVKLDEVRTVILDEADEMLNMGFVDDINEILSHVPEERKMLLFSATMPREIADIAKNYMHDPVEFVAGVRNEGSANVRHIYYMVKASDKYNALKRIVDYLPRIYGIVFCRTRASAQEVASQLIQDGYDADALHGDLSQAQRDAVMKKFRERNLQLLVATDVAARGLDVNDLTHIISYSLPDDNDIYNHRSGRTGRAGKTGISIAIIHSRERSKLRQIEKQIGKEFERREVPKAEEIIEKQLFNLADRLENVEVQEDEIAPYLPNVLKKLSWLSGEDVIKRLLSLEFNRLLEYYKKAPVLDIVPEKKERSRGEKKERNARNRKPNGEKDRRTGEDGYERVFINVGKSHGFYAPDLIRMINATEGGKRIGIGRIDLLTNYSLFDVRQGEAHTIINALRNSEFFGKRLYLEIADVNKDYASITYEGEVKKNRAERRKAKFEAMERERQHRNNRRTRRDAERGFKKSGKSSDAPAGNYDKFIKKGKRKK
ncbi:MAG: DEAD/DEAH box helicase [Muribaculaceae bacterium]|nr:DEAD/DEAH box helicase [Muribaculaceae bacterium]